MKKHALKLNRETVRALETAQTAKVQGAFFQGNELKCTGCDSGCGIFD